MRNGLAVCCVLWLLMGSLLVDRHGGDLAAGKSPIRYCSWRFFQLVSAVVIPGAISIARDTNVIVG